MASKHAGKKLSHHLHDSRLQPSSSTGIRADATLRAGVVTPYLRDDKHRTQEMLATDAIYLAVPFDRGAVLAAVRCWGAVVPLPKEDLSSWDI